MNSESIPAASEVEYEKEVKMVYPAAFLSAKGTVWSERGATKIRLGRTWGGAYSRLPKPTPSDRGEEKWTQEQAQAMYDALAFAKEVIEDQAKRFHQDCRCQLCESLPMMIDAAMTALYRRFKEWHKRDFGPDDVTWCEVKADILQLCSINSKDLICLLHRAHNHTHNDNQLWMDIEEAINSRLPLTPEGTNEK